MRPRLQGQRRDDAPAVRRVPPEGAVEAGIPESDRSELIAFLDRSQLALIWVLRGERRSLKHVEDPKQYPGETEITGTAILRDDQIDEDKHSKFFTVAELQARNYE